MDNDLTNVLVSKQQAGQPAPTSSGESSEGAKDQTQLAALIAEQVAAALEQHDRKNQSKLDKMEARVKKQVAALRTAGVEPTADIMQAIRQAADDEDQPASPATSAPKPAQARAQEASTPADWRAVTRDTLYAKYGVQLTADDPELATVKASDIEELTDTLRDALKAKKARVEQAQTLGAQGRLPVVPASGTPAGIEEEYQRELKQIRRGDVMAITQLQAKYKERGMK